MRRFLIVASFSESIVGFRGLLIDMLIGEGFEVHIACPGLGDGDQATRMLELKGCVVHDILLRRSGLNPFYDFAGFVSLFLLIRKISPQYLISYTIKPVIYASLAGRLAKVPHRFALITGLGYSFSGARGFLPFWVGVLSRSLYRLSLRFVECVFFQNPDDEALFRDIGLVHPAARSKVVAGSGVDLEFFPYSPVSKSPISFLLIARLIADKGVREYVEAARTLKNKYPALNFFIVGWIDDNPSAVSDKELGGWVDSGCIEYLGKLEDVRPAIAKSHVFVLPSYREGTPRTVLEAMAMGRPVITTDAPGCRETIVHEYNGYLVPIKNVAAISEAMLKFIENPKLVLTMGKRSREIAEKKYDVHKVNQTMLEEMGIR